MSRPFAESEVEDAADKKNEVKKNKEVNKNNKKNEKKIHWRRLPIID